MSAIWKIFLLHIVVPNEYPVFDQHVGRAFYYLTNAEIREIPVSNTDKEKLYFENYEPFFKNIATANLSQKKVDESLWSFGKFLKSDYAKSIINTKNDNVRPMHF